MPNEQIKSDMDIAKEFLSALDPDATEFTFQTFDDNQDRRDGSLAQVLHGSLDDHFEMLCALSSKGAGVFVTINETDLRGRKTKNIIRVRALWVDTDGAPQKPIEEKLEPHIVVESSSGNYHDYHLVQDCPLDDFRAAQKHLIKVFGSDKGIHDLPRVMRLPGFPHQKVCADKGLTGEPFMVRMIEDTAFFGPTDWEQLKSRIYALQPPKQETSELSLFQCAAHTTPQIDVGEKPSRAEAEDVLSYIDPDIGYDDWRTVLMGLHSLSDGYLDLAEDWSSGGSKYVQGEVAGKWKGFNSAGGIGWGSVCQLAKENGADLSEIAKKHRGGSGDCVSKFEFDAFGGSQSTMIIPKIDIVPTLFKMRPANEIPPRQWLFGKHLIRGFLSLTVAPGGLGKSSMLLVEALAMTTGKPLLKTAPPKPLRVWVWNGEDPREEIERRIAAACIHFSIQPEEIGDRLLVDSGRDVPITLAEYGGGTVNVATPFAEMLERAIRDAQVDVLVIDPFVTSHQVPENDTTAMNAVVATWRRIADATGCAIELVHHVSKHGALNADDVGIYSARGAGALIDGVRSARQLIRMNASEAELFGVEDASSYFRTVVGKANLAPPDKAEWRHMIGVPLNNGRDFWDQGDTVGVCTLWTPTDVFESISARDLQKVQQAIEACDSSPSLSELAGNWVGYVVGEVLGYDLAPGTKKAERSFSQNSARAKVRTMLKVWIGTNSLVVNSIEDSRNGRTKKVIEVGEPVTNEELGK